MIKQFFIGFAIVLILFYSCRTYPENSAKENISYLLPDERVPDRAIVPNESLYLSSFTKRGSYLNLSDTMRILNNNSTISDWDMHIIVFSDTLNWDWRLLASLIWQESRFKPNVTSFAGAYGLMQVMPQTGRNFGIDIKSSPENNIRGGVTYLRHLQHFFAERIPDDNERLKFILAAYNAGEGNVVDAMRLAEKHGRNPLIWDNNVAFFLLKKSEPEYYNDPVVRNGYCRGHEPVNFVTGVLERYAQYLSVTPQQIN